jgi:pullulanase
MDRLAIGIVLTSQGIPFLHAGDEFLRSKNGVKNSYNSNAPDVNPIKWGLKTENLSTYQYYRGLIELRKKHPAFRMTTKQDVDRHFQRIQTDQPAVYAYRLNDAANNDTWREIVVILNGSRNTSDLALPRDLEGCRESRESWYRDH